MGLLDLSQFAIFGPGSEWFWFMAQFGALAITGVAIYRQLRAQGSASVFEQTAEWDREWASEFFQRRRLRFLLDMEGRAVEAGLPRSGEAILDFFERIGYLVVNGHARAQYVWLDFRGLVGNYWALIAPYTARERIALDNPRLLVWFERLEQEMRAFDRKALGHVRTFDHDAIVRGLPALIDELVAGMRLEHDLKQGKFPRRAPAKRPEPAPPGLR